ncbi:acyltransferase family protein [Pseudomonas citronellolis]|uniref:acyltransferase family protein n=1 Tax=Pseudomonas citronellolis TaxID=53408 RepID=UPI002FD9D159
MSQRNLGVDVLRGLGILFVVSGHASSGSMFYPFAPYSFHMPLFFFISGLFFSESKIDGAFSVVLKSAKSLLLYSTLYYCVYALICQALLWFGFVQLYHPLSLDRLFLNQFGTGGAYGFTAAYWFIPCLFFVKVYFSLVHARISSFLKGRFRASFSILMISLYAVIAFWAVNSSMDMYAESAVTLERIVLLRFAFALFFYYAGSLFMAYSLQERMGNIFLLGGIYVVQQQFWAYAGNLDFWMQISKYQQSYLPVISSVLSICFFFGVSGVLSKNRSFSMVLGYIGRNSLPIVLHHIFGFFTVNAVLCLLGVIQPAQVVSVYYQWDTVHTWPLYMAVGVSYSLLFDRYVSGPIARQFRFWQGAMMQKFSGAR